MGVIPCNRRVRALELMSAPVWPSVFSRMPLRRRGARPLGCRRDRCHRRLSGSAQSAHQRAEAVAAAITGRGGVTGAPGRQQQAFLTASVLVGLKAELLEASILPPAPEIEGRPNQNRDGWIQRLTCPAVRNVICSVVRWRHLRYSTGHPWRTDRTAGVDRRATRIGELSRSGASDEALQRS